MARQFSITRGLVSAGHQLIPRTCNRKRSLTRSVRMAAAIEAELGVANLQDYDTLCERLKEISTINGVNGLLMWDEMVMMPPGAAEIRASQKSILTGIVYDKLTSPEIGDLLKKVEGMKVNLDDYQAAVYREAKREYVKSTAVPKHIEKRRSELESEGYQSWVAARQAKDFSKFVPVLQEWIGLIRERSKFIDSSKPCYDVALQDFEKGMSTSRLDEIFSEVKEGLVPFIAKLREKGTPPDASPLAGGPFDAKIQAEVCNKIAEELGFDLKNGRLDVSIHPFTGGAHPRDVRMTTRFKEHDLTEGLTGAIHETGHALYEQARNLQYDGLPVNEALSMGIHESQSLLWERMVGLSSQFSVYLTPKLKEAFPQLLKDLTPEQVYGASNVMKVPSLIRVEADEVQYPLHILLRFEIEKSLADGSLDVNDVPKVWNQKMKDYLGVEPKDDGEGCLQDMHWSAGAFAYFPTYLLGAMYACQIFEKAKEDIPGLQDNIARGKFSELRQWLAEKVHSKGSLYPSGDELMLAVTGKALEPKAFLQYLTEKYSKLYKL